MKKVLLLFIITLTIACEKEMLTDEGLVYEEIETDEECDCDVNVLYWRVNPNGSASWAEYDNYIAEGPCIFIRDGVNSYTWANEDAPGVDAWEREALAAARAEGYRAQRGIGLKHCD